MITLKSCPNCNGSGFTEYKVLLGGDLVTEITPGVKVDGVIITRYVICQNCRLIFQNPRLSDKELDIYYKSGYYRKKIDQPLGGMDASEANRARADAKIIREHMGKVKSHLDVGCGLGYLLKTVNAQIKVGTESDMNYPKFKELKVYQDLKKVFPKKFDLVTSIHSLEHVPHPLNYLKDMAKFINKGGHMVIEVPSWKTRGGPLGFAHLSHFEPDVLKLMCMQAGLSVVHLEFTPHLLLVCKPDN